MNNIVEQEKKEYYISFKKELFNIIVPYLYKFYIYNLNSRHIKLADKLRTFNVSGTSKNGIYSGTLNLKFINVLARTCEVMPHALTLTKQERSKIMTLLQYCKSIIKSSS